MVKYVEIIDSQKLVTARLVNKHLDLAKICVTDDIESLMEEYCPHFKKHVLRALHGDINNITRVKTIELILAKSTDLKGSCEVLIVNHLRNDEVYIKLVPFKKLTWLSKYVSEN